LTLSEILTILIAFHQSQYRTFKAFYLLHLSQHARGEFPHLLSDTRFVALIPRALMPLCVYLNTRHGTDTGIAFTDSTTWPGCFINLCAGPETDDHSRIQRRFSQQEGLPAQATREDVTLDGRNRPT
jgi:hypothetical protein